MRNKLRRNKNLQNAASNAEEGRERPTGPIALSSSSEDDSAADRKESRSSCRKGASIATVFLRNQRRTSKRSSDGEPGRPEERLLQKTEPLLQRDDVRSSQLTANHGLAESSRREQLTPADLQSCLEKIKALNPAFPVQSVFCSLQRKSRQKLQEASGDCRGGPKEFLSAVDSSHPDTSCERLPKRPRSSPPPEAAAGSCFVPGQEVHGGCILKEQRSDRKLSRSHRLKQRERLHPTTSDNLRGSCSEDRLWTDKYCPQHSNQLIGNSASVSKLHSWLKSWKRGSDAEEGRLTGDGKHKGSWDCGDFQGEAAVRNGREEPLSNGVLLTGPSGVGKTASVYACAQELGFKVFEVNSSSQRCGRQVLSQLKEATRSHLVEPSGEDPLKPVYFNNYNQSSFSPKPGREQLPRSITSSSKTKTVPNSCSAGGKVKTRAAALARYFKTKEKADRLHLSGILHSGMSDTEERDNASLICDQSGKQNKETAMSLILFEEVDVIFEDDVGFVAAIRSFVTTTKRPVVLTSNDPFLRERFSCSLEEIVFKTPPAASVCSYLQLTCLAEDAWVDSADVSRLLRLTGGDVRRCLLQLQLWVCSSRGRTCQPGRLTPARSQHCKASVGGSQRPPYQPGCSDYMLGLLPVTPDYLQNTLKSPSWSESDLTKLLNHLAESWSQGVPLLYSNLELLLPSSLLHLEDKPDPPQQKGFICSDDELHTQLAGQRRCDTSGQSVRSVSRLSRRKRALSKFPSSGLTNRQTRLSETCSRMPSFSNKAGKQTAEAAAGRLDALADLFDLMSYIDTTLTEAELLVSGSNACEAFVWTGAAITDGVLDKMGEEVEGRRNQDVKAAVEGLGFHRFWRRDSETWTRAQRSKQDLEDKPWGRQQDTQLFVMSSTNQNVSFTPHPACAASESDSRSRVSRLVLSSTPFSLLGNRRAVCVDYMPVLRSFCHKLHVNQRGETGEGRRSYPSLPKSTLRLLAQDVTLRKPQKDS